MKADMEPDSRPVNLYRHVKGKLAPAVYDRLDNIQAAVENSENRRARDKATQHRFRECLRALCLDATDAKLADANLLLGVSRDKTKLSGNAVYPEFVTAKPFRDALDGLVRTGYLVQPILGNQGSGKSSRIRGTQQLISALDIEGFNAGVIADASPLIVLNIGPKGGKTRRSYKETAQTMRWSDNLERINANNARYALTLNISAIDIEHLENERSNEAVADEAVDDNAPQYQRINFRRDRLHRVFNSVDWTQGGRFYGGWWQSIPRRYRQHIQINGKPTCEHDFSGMHLRLLYHHAKKPLPTIDDPYSEPYGIEHRKVVKRAFNVMLNAKRRPLQTSVPEFDAERLGMSWRTFLDGLVEHHSSVKEYFYKGFGRQLQRQDANIAEAVLLKLTGMQYPCLPIHDSFITYATLSDELPVYMEEVAAEAGLAQLHVKRDYLTEHTGPTGLVKDSITEILDGMTKANPT